MNVEIKHWDNLGCKIGGFVGYFLVSCLFIGVAVMYKQEGK